MKANQSFKQNDEAVSPVIGVILMVAITVVLAAVVFVLVGNLTEDSGDSAPTIQMTKTTDGFRVDGAPSTNPPTWHNATGAADAGQIYFSGTCTASGVVSGVTDGATVSVGDAVTGCTSGETLTVVYKGETTSSTLRSFTF